MKKILPLLAMSALLLTPALAMAQSGGFKGDGANPGGGYTGPDVGVMKVVDVISMWDDSPVYMEGNIVMALGDENYQFTDGSGIITVDIDDDDWMGLTVGPNDKVGIWGELDKDWKSVKVDVDRIIKK